MTADPERPTTGVAGWIGAAVVSAVLVLSACSGSSEPSATVGPSSTSSTSSSTTTLPAASTTTMPPASTTTMPPASTTTLPPAPTPTTTAVVPVDVATLPFSVEVGRDGVTYDLDGSPPSGPTSFAVLDDGSVVVADTMAVSRGEPRLLHYDRTGELAAVIDLADYDVAAIVDVVSDGTGLAILDVFVAMDRYRVLSVSVGGAVEKTTDVPPGFRFEDGLTGLAWDDTGVLLEFEFGARYARLAESGTVESPVVPVFDGTTVELKPGVGRTTEVTTNRASFTVERATDVGGVTLVGIAPDDSIVLFVDEVDLSGQAIVVMRRVQRYSPSGELEAERMVDPAQQFLDIPRPLELDATGAVLYLVAEPDQIVFTLIQV